MPRCRLRRVPSVVLTTLLVAAFPGAGHSQEGAPFVDRVDVEVVNVEVFVTDRDGEPVPRLARDDFEVFEDGRPVEVTNFYTVTWFDSLTGAPPPSPEIAAASVPVEQRLSLAVFVDPAALLPQDWQRISPDLRSFLAAEASRGTRVLLATEGGGLKVMQPFTRDRYAVEDALSALDGVAPRGPVQEAERRQVMRSMTMLAQSARESLQSGDTRGAGASYSSAYDLIRSYVARVEADLRRTEAGVDQLLRAMSGLPGRRALLYVGGGLPQRPGEELYQHFQDLFMGLSGQVDAGSIVDPTLESLLTDETDLYRRLARAANTGQVTLYTLDTSGPGGHDSLAADSGFEAAAGGVGGPTTLDALRSQNMREPMLAMAHGTGGLALAGSFSFADRLGVIGRDFQSYYSLGYRSPASGDGKYHRIEVRVNRPGVNVRHRNGYVDRPEDEQVADRTLSSLLVGLEHNPLDVRVDFLEPKEPKGDRMQLPVLVRVPVARITVLPEGAVARGRLHFYILVRDEKGGISDLHRHPYPVEIPSGELAASRERELAYLVNLEVRTGRPEVAVGVWDELSGEQSFLSRAVIVDPGAGGR